MQQKTWHLRRGPRGILQTTKHREKPQRGDDLTKKNSPRQSHFCSPRGDPYLNIVQVVYHIANIYELMGDNDQATEW